VTAIANMQRSLAYDAENRQVSATINGQTTTYVYDGDGHRVTKVAPSGTTVFVYDPYGNLAQEYGPPTDTGTKYLTSDALGSTRLVTTSTGTMESSYDFLPFGDEIESGTAGRGATFPTSAYPHPPSTQDLEFTSKERDAETGLDNFLARYFSSAQGRFTSPDEPFADQDEDNPQSWNLYAYGRNNPLRNIDPTGRCSQGAGGYTDEGSGLFPGPCSGGQIGEQKAGNNSTTVGVGRDEANLIMLQGIGENLSSPHQWATIVSGAGQGAATLLAPLPTAIAQCAAASLTGGQCSKTSVAMAAIPFGPGRLARILGRHSALSVAKNVSKFAKGLDDAAHVESMVESALASPTRATGYADGAAYVDANLGVTIGTDPAGRATTTIRVVLDNAGNVHSAFPVPQIH
jgi:RHS repeat-associated protein